MDREEAQRRSGGEVVSAERTVAPGVLTALIQEIASAPGSGAGWGVALRAGAQVGPYRLVRELGRGGFGSVWEARDEALARPVAFKAVRAPAETAAREDRLLREAEIAARLDHPGIVKLLDAGRCEHGPYLVFELLRGSTLAVRVADGPLPLGEAMRIAREVTSAVARAHAEGVVHRDLKPANVFLCDDGAVKVLDFGLAHAFGARRIHGGTPSYMAPEQWRGAPEDERTDVFALGVLVYEMLTGDVPFPRGGDPAADAAGEPPALDIPGAPALADLVWRMLERDPVQRPRDAAQVLSALAALAPAIERAARSPAAVPVRVRRSPPRGRSRSGTRTPERVDADVRHATIVRCDLVGSTALRKSLDLGEQVAFTAAWEDVAMQVADDHGGQLVGPVDGDAVTIAFGYPYPLEDMAPAAVNAGFDLVERIRSQGLLGAGGLDVRVGIATGPVAVVKSAVPSTRGPIAGLTIDVAERLRAAADPGRVVIADATRRLAGGFFEYEDLALIRAAGFEEGVRAWRVVRPTDVISRFEAHRAEGSAAIIHGREAELAALAAAWAASRDGQGRAVCLEGEAGMGKSRLARAALDHAAREGAAVLELDCTPSTRYSPLFPVGVLLQRAAGITAATARGDRHDLARSFLEDLAPAAGAAEAFRYLAPLFGIEDGPAANEVPEELRAQTIAAVAGALRAFAARRPVAILCEDLHWVDDTTARVIDLVASEVAALRALMIVTWRPNEGEPPPVHLDRFGRITVESLDASTAADLVRSVARGGLAEESVAQVVARAEGVPLVLEELARGMVAAPEGGGAGAASGQYGAAAPSELQLVVESRLARLPQFTREVQAASVLGRDFLFHTLERMLPSRPSGDLAEMVRAFAREGVFERPVSRVVERVRFKHAMIREAVHETLLPGESQRLHSTAADTLASDRAGTPDAAPDVLAEHLRLARRYVESARMRLAAGADTAARGAYVEAEGNCAAGLELIGNVADEAERRRLHAELLLQLAVAQVGRLGYSAAEVERTYRAAEEIVGPGAEPALLYPIERGLATFNLVRGNLAVAHALSLEGLDLAERSGRPEFRIDAMSVHSYATLYFGRLEDCRRWLDRCLALYREERGERFTYPVPQDAGTAAWALLPTAAWLLGDAQGAEDAMREGVAHVERLGRNFDRALLHAWHAGTRYTQRRWADAAREADEAERLARGRYREWHAIAALMGLLARAAMQPAPEALGAALGICAAFAEKDVHLNASYYLAALARGQLTAGNAPVAAALLDQAVGAARASQETRMDAELLILRAELEPDDARALPHLARALAVADEQGAVATALRAAVDLARRSLADPDRAALALGALDMLEGRAAWPPGRDAMRELLAALRPPAVSP